MKDRTSRERLGGTYAKEEEQPLGTKDTDVCTKLSFPRNIVSSCPEISNQEICMAERTVHSGKLI